MDYSLQDRYHLNSTIVLNGYSTFIILIFFLKQILDCDTPGYGVKGCVINASHDISLIFSCKRFTLAY